MKTFCHTQVSEAPYRQQSYAKLIVALAESEMCLRKVSLVPTGMMASVVIESILEGTDEQYEAFQQRLGKQAS